MNVISFVFGLVALVLFVVEAVRTKALLPWGFAALTAAWMLSFLVESEDLITF